MTDLKAKVAKFCEFDDDATRDTAKHEDSDGYFGFITGATWENARLKPLLDLMPEMVEHLTMLKNYIDTSYAPTPMRMNDELLAKIQTAVRGGE